MADLPDIFVANYPTDPEVPNCVTGTRNDKVVVNFPNPGKYGRVLQDPVEPATKPSGYCSNIPPAVSIPVFEDSTNAATPTAASFQAGSSSSTSTPGYLTAIPTTPAANSSSSSSSTELVQAPLTNMPISSGNATGPRLSTPTSPPSVVRPTNTSAIVTESTSIDLSFPPSPNATGPSSLSASTPTLFPNNTLSRIHTLLSPSPCLSELTSTLSANHTLSLIHTLPPSLSTTEEGGGNPNPLMVSKPSDQAVPCPVHGDIVCLGEGMFGVCNWGWAIPQPLAAGTECNEGRIGKREREWKDLVKEGR